jgi:hypothetical protein
MGPSFCMGSTWERVRPGALHAAWGSRPLARQNVHVAPVGPYMCFDRRRSLGGAQAHIHTFHMYSLRSS